MAQSVRGADLHMVQLMPLPLTVSCFSKIHIGFTFLVQAHLGGPGQMAINGCVCAAYHKSPPSQQLTHSIYISRTNLTSIHEIQPSCILPAEGTSISAQRLAWYKLCCCNL